MGWDLWQYGVCIMKLSTSIIGILVCGIFFSFGMDMFVKEYSHEEKKDLFFTGSCVMSLANERLCTLHRRSER